MGRLAMAPEQCAAGLTVGRCGSLVNSLAIPDIQVVAHSSCRVFCGMHATVCRMLCTIISMVSASSCIKTGKLIARQLPSLTHAAHHCLLVTANHTLA
jgi:hypothetical protein